MASLSYDLIVLGDDFTGLVAATLCASRGMRVLLAEPHKVVSSYRLGKETLPVSPLVLSGILKPGVERVLSELDFEHLMRRRIADRPIPFQLLGPRIRLEAHSDSERFARALKRETGRSAAWLLGSVAYQEILDGLLRESVCIPGTGFWEKRELAKRLPEADAAAEEWAQGGDTSDSESFLARLCHLAVTGGSSTSPIELARSVSSILQGVPSLKGDAQAWRSLFLEKFRAHSGETRILTPQKIETSWGKVTGLSAVDDEVRCDHMIAAMPAQQLIPLLDAKAAKRLGPQPTPRAYRYNLNLLVHMSGLPEGLSGLAASMLDPGADPSGGNFALISHKAAEGPGRAIVSLQGFAPCDSEGQPDLADMREALLEHALERMPFLDAHIESIDSPNEEPTDGQKRDLAAPLAPRALWDAPRDKGLHIAALPYSSGTKQMWIVGEQSMPGLGLEGQCIAAFSVAKLASAGASKAKSSAKPSVLSASGN